MTLMRKLSSSRRRPTEWLGLIRTTVPRIALVALGLACWPKTDAAGDGIPARRAMLAYNALVAVYLAYLGLAAHLAGLLLWPAVAEHVVVTLLLVGAWRRTS